MSANLIVVPDTDGGTFDFYSGQIIKLTATLTVTSGYIPDNETIQFSPVDLSAYLQPYLYQADPQPYTPGGTTNPGTTTVVVHKDGLQKAYAYLYILVWGSADATKARLEELTKAGGLQISALATQTGATFTTPYTAKQIGVMAPMPNGLQLQPASVANVTPDQAQGNYLKFTFYVEDPTTRKPLRNMCVRLYTTPNAAVLKNITLFNQNAQGDYIPLKAQTDPMFIQSIDTFTDATGYVDVYICPIATTGSYIAQLNCKIGIYQTPGYYFCITDIFQWPTNPLPDANITAPLVDSNPVNLDSVSGQFYPATIPKYRNPVVGDVIFFFCNNDYQGTFPVSTISELGTKNTQFTKCGVHSQSYGETTENTMQYFVIPEGDQTSTHLSSQGNFWAIGDPGIAVPQTAGTFVAPTILEQPFVGIINQNTIKDGIHVRIALNSAENPELASWVDVGDVVNAFIYLNGYQPNSNAPKTAVRPQWWLWEFLQWPQQWDTTRYVTQADITKGEIIVWYPQANFAGFAQNSKGQYGTFQVQYVVSKSNTLEQKFSQVLQYKLDTVPPGGKKAHAGTVIPKKHK